jgi:hypothetical protein
MAERQPVMSVHQRVPISGNGTKATGLAEQLSMTGLKGLLGLTWQRRVPLKIPMLTQLTNPLRGCLFESLNIPR